MLNRIKNLVKDYVWDKEMNYKNCYGRTDISDDDSIKLRRIAIIGRDIVKIRIASVLLVILALNMLMETFCTELPSTVGIVLTLSLLIAACDLRTRITFLRVVKEQASCAYKYGNAYYGNFVNVKAEAARKSVFLHPSKFFTEK